MSLNDKVRRTVWCHSWGDNGGDVDVDSGVCTGRGEMRQINDYPTLHTRVYKTWQQDLKATNCTIYNCLRFTAFTANY